MIQIIFMVCLIGILFLFQHKYWERIWNDGLKVDLRFSSPELTVGENGTLRITVENDKKIPLPILMVKFQTDKHLMFGNEKGNATTDQFYHNDIFQVGAGERVTRDLTFHGIRRGYFKINNVDLMSGDILLSGQFYNSFQPNESVYVLPKPLDSNAFHMIIQQIGGELLTRRNLYEDPFELRGIREYQPFDSMKSINWKATAKTGQFMVNQKAYTAPKSVRIFLNLEDHHIFKNTDGLEDSITIAADLVRYLYSQKIKVGIYCNAKDLETDAPVLMKPCSLGENHLSSILRGLARADLEKPALPFEKLMRNKILKETDSVYTCFISPNQDPEFLNILFEFASAGNHSWTWFYPVPGKYPMNDIPNQLRKNVKPVKMK